MMLCGSGRTIRHTETEKRLWRLYSGSSEEYWTMDESLIQPWDIGERKTRWGCKPILQAKIMTLAWEKKVPANFVPAAAVIRKGQVLFRWTGRKELLGGYRLLKVKCRRWTLKSPLKHITLSLIRVCTTVVKGRIKSINFPRSSESEDSIPKKLTLNGKGMGIDRD